MTTRPDTRRTGRTPMAAVLMMAALTLTACNRSDDERTAAGRPEAETGGEASADVRLVSDQTATDSRKGNSMETRISKSGYDITPYPEDKVAELASKLDDEAYRITQKAGTEAPFCGGLLDEKDEGIYTCVVCGLPLFSSEHKFKSGTGWPSFYTEFDPEHVSKKPDRGHGMVRTEITCARCDAHLGHVFDDGPPPTGQRFCLNSASLGFHQEGRPLPPESRPVESAGASASQAAAEPAPGRDTGKATRPTANPAAKSTAESAAASGEEVAYFAGGCFWGLEHYFQKGPGVVDAASGYMQGECKDPTYEQVCSDATGHAETVKVVFDPEQVSYRRLLEAFFEMHDPTQLNRQGPDVGEQYRSGIWYADDAQKKEAEKYIAELQASDRFQGRKIVTELEAARTFYPAEDYHQDYIERTGRACHVSNPW